MRTNSTWLVYCVMTVLLVGCALLQNKNDPLQNPAMQKPAMEERKIDKVQPKPVVVTVAVQGNQVEDLLKYAQTFAAMSADAQKKEIVRLPKEKSGLSRMQLTLALGLPASHYRDIPRALALLDEELKDSASKDSDLRNLVAVLKALLTDRQRLDESLQQQTQNLQQQAQKLKDEQKRTYDLQQKLDDLKNLEMMINQEHPK